MKQCFLKKTDKKSLDLVFLGYGQDEKPFQYLKDITPNSVALVYDYTDRDFDPSLYYEFEDINLITWSMGVMAAPKVLNKYDLLKKVSLSTAINGTLEGIDDKLGIPLSMWQATIDALDEANSVKFYRRMCTNLNTFNEYMKKRPERSVESLKSELKALIPFSQEPLVKDFVYSTTITGMKDRIFSPLNVLASCKLHKQNVMKSENGHYSKDDIERAFVFHLI